MFEMIDTDNSGHITFEELKAGISRIGSNLKESEIYDLMQAVCVIENVGVHALRYMLLYDIFWSPYGWMCLYYMSVCTNGLMVFAIGEISARE